MGKEHIKIKYTNYITLPNKLVYKQEIINKKIELIQNEE